MVLSFLFGAHLSLNLVTLLHHQEHAIDPMIQHIILNAAVGDTSAAWLIMFDVMMHRSLSICSCGACVA